MLVKICGLCNVMDALAAVEAGADALGFVMGGKVLPAEIEPHAQLVREIIKKIPSSVDTFLVTHLSLPEDILDLANYINVSGVQISEEIDVRLVEQVRLKTKKKIIKTVIVDAFSLTKLEQYSKYADYILLDSQVAGYVGGTGVINDWMLSKQLVEASSIPVYLAGGLRPDNVREAIDKVHPHGVDVSTGVSAYSDIYLRKDRKSENKIKDFINAAKEINSTKI